MSKKEQTREKSRTMEINGKEYPCFRTMAANFDFKDITGKEVNKIDLESVTELITYMWATLRGACHRMGVEFPYETPRELSYYIDETNIQEWSELMNDTPDGGKKK